MRQKGARARATDCSVPSMTSLRNRSRAGSNRSRGNVSRNCSRFSMSSDGNALADARLKSTANQVDHFSKWFNRERSEYEMMQRGRPSTGGASIGHDNRARIGAPGQSRAGCGVAGVDFDRHHAGPVQPHLNVHADFGWLSGAGTKSQVVARSRSITPSSSGQRGFPQRDTQSPIPTWATTQAFTTESRFDEHKDRRWIASVTPPPLTPNTRLTLGAPPALPPPLRRFADRCLLCSRANRHAG